MARFLWLADRSAVLLLGVVVGAAIGFAFGGGGTSAPPPAIVSPGVPGAPAAPTADASPEVVMARQGSSRMIEQLRTTLAADRPVRIGVFGDSFGDGVWAGLLRLLPRSKGFSVEKFSQQATGFTRYRTLNLEKRAGEQLGNDPIDIAVISFGANDTQGIITDGGKYAALMSPEWQKAIGERIDRFVALLRARGAMVYWVGLPVMREAKFEADAGAINRFYASRMAALNVPFMDSRPIAADAKGQFAVNLPDPLDGKMTLVRAPDGIHMSMQGYVWITRALAARIRAYVDAVRPLAGKAAAPAAPAAPAKDVRKPAETTKPAAAPSVPSTPKRDRTPERDRDRTRAQEGTSARTTGSAVTPPPRERRNQSGNGTAASPSGNSAATSLGNSSAPQPDNATRK